ncbi:relE (plasmid) [Escherichia fergusonii]|nr:relE [Escherichia fergusonii]
MTYTVKFRDDALKEWLKLDKTIQQQFVKKRKRQRSTVLTLIYW